MSSSINEGTQARDMSMPVEPEEAVMIAARAAGDKKSTDIVLLDLREVASFTEFFLICTGANPRQV